MKLFVVVLVCLVGYGEGGALRCTSGDQDSSCREQEKEPPIQISEDRITQSQLTECLAGSEWESNCHSCQCSKDGFPKCEKMAACDKEYAEPTRCKPNTTFARDCNTCTCVDNGMLLCTLAYCEKLPILKPSEGKECAPGSHWKSQCNDCGCTEDGYAYCTEKACIGLENEPLKRCAPESRWIDDCNNCWCTSNGDPVCTKRTCVRGPLGLDIDAKDELEKTDLNLGVDHIERHSVCKPRGVFYIGCNTCHCNPYGTDYSCTNKPCPLPEDVELFHELKATKSHTNNTKKIVCVANRMFIKDCNTCWCNEDGTSFFCTRKVCVSEFPDEDGPGEEKLEELRVIKRDCRPDEVFELDCNMCRCNPDGKSFSCTRRACIEPVDEEVKNSTLSRKIRDITSKNEPTKNCLPNQEFRMDCNKCLCDPAGQDFSCTRIDCYQLNNNNHAEARTRREATDPGQKCVPGTKFKMDCNTCQCSMDGYVAMCSLEEDCGKRSKRETESSPSQNSENVKHPESRSEEKKEETSDVKTETKSVGTTPPTDSDPNFRCNPGEQFKRGCNDCSCSADGKSFFCTVRFCDQDITPPTSH